MFRNFNKQYITKCSCFNLNILLEYLKGKLCYSNMRRKTKPLSNFGNILLLELCNKVENTTKFNKVICSETFL